MIHTDWIKKLKAYQQPAALFTGLFLAACMWWGNPLSLTHPQNLVLSMATLMISWWILDALPLAVVALVPIIAFPLLQISPIKEVTKSYADSVVFLFMGGFFIGIAIEKWQLHKRIALSIINITGTNGNKIIMGFIIASGFLSMWLSNTATTMMMYPIALSVIHVMDQHPQEGTNPQHFKLVLMLSIAYASNFALGTIIGTPPNVAYVNYISDKFNYNIGFMDWMMVFTPLTIILLLLLYWVMVKWLYPNKIQHTEAGRQYIQSELQKLGPMNRAEKRVAIIFLITVLGWIGKDFINSAQTYLVLDDTIIALSGALLMFMVPAGNDPNNQGARLLVWEDTSKMAWGILILFGGGIALAKALEEVQLMNQLGQFIAGYATNNVFLMIVLITTLSIFLSEVMSNVAQVIVMAPVVSSIATAIHMDPLLLGIPMTLGASCASMLPMGTPPNAIVFASGYIRLKDMMKAGFVLNILCIIVISLFCYFVQPIIIKLM